VKERSPRDRGARVVLAVVGLALAIGSAVLDLPRASRGEFWGDSATYHAMAWSLARDFDVRFEARDLERIRREYPGGPQGLFLKRASGGLTVDAASGFPWVRRVRADEGRLYYGKALLHPLVAAPLVALFGTRGLTLLNGLLLAAVVWLAFGLLRRRGLSPAASLAAAAGLLLVSVVPVYLAWPTPEIFALALVAFALAAWAAGRPMLSAALFGLAGYVKPPNLLMAAPLGLGPLVDAFQGRAAGATAWRAVGRGLAESSKRGIAMAAAALACAGLNAVFTGEVNYQGGERKTFYGRFPFDDQGTRFEDAGFWMTTNQVGPLVEGRDEQSVTAASGPARDPREIRQSFALNLGYFWVGRFGGALAYFPGAVAALALFLLAGPRDRAGWLALAAVLLSWLAYLWIIPDNWYGGGGTVGNRYFLAVLPAFLFLVPPRAGLLVGAAALAGALAFLAPVLASPLRSSLAPGAHTMRLPLRALPAELTMLNDLAVFNETWRKKRPVGFTGDASRHADPSAYFLYFLDDGTWGREQRGERVGFWLRAGASAEVVVRAFDLQPVEAIVVRILGGPRGDQVSVRHGLRSRRVGVGPGEERELELAVGRGVRYYDTYLYPLRFDSRRGAPLPDGRPVSVFVDVRLVLAPDAGRGR
jgi:hypothetical protein